MSIFWFALIITALLVVVAYNSLIKKSHRVKEAWADIDVQLKRRYDLVPNLIEAVKGYMAHEKEVFEKVTEARTRAMGTTDSEEKIKAENQFTQTLKTLFAVAENYPELKANQSFIELQKELVDTEDKIQAARRFYNSNVRDYNIAIKVFPRNILAQLFSFKVEPLFEITEAAEREAVKVKF
jgi:LemA protein